MKGRLAELNAYNTHEAATARSPELMEESDTSF